MQKRKDQNDPAEVIRKALSEALVFYYPFAGRIREIGPNGKLAVDCNGEGAMFVEADADITLEEFGPHHALSPPFPYLHQLLDDFPGANQIVDSPLLLIQVTRLKCGGFILANRMNHAMADAAGFLQFITAIGEIARGIRLPTIQPVWCRELLTSRDPPRITFTHNEYVDNEIFGDVGAAGDQPTEDLAYHSAFFGPSEISCLKKLIPHDQLKNFSSFDIIMAWLWRCRTIALRTKPDEQVRLIFLVNARSKFNPALPIGYYGNVIAFAPVETKSKTLCESPLEYACDLIKKAKRNVTEEYMRSLADYLVVNGRPCIKLLGSYFISDVRHAGHYNLDFGWGKPVYSGPANHGTVPDLGSFFMLSKNAKGEEGVVVPICLPTSAMQRFLVEMEKVNNLRGGGKIVNDFERKYLHAKL